MACRFPPPWTVEEEDAHFVVREHNGQQLAYIYFKNEPGRQSAAKVLNRDEARRIAAQSCGRCCASLDVGSGALFMVT
jgi:hypothetical protein